MAHNLLCLHRGRACEHFFNFPAWMYFSIFHIPSDIKQSILFSLPRNFIILYDDIFLYTLSRAFSLVRILGEEALKWMLNFGIRPYCVQYFRANNARTEVISVLNRSHKIFPDRFNGKRNTRSSKSLLT